MSAIKKIAIKHLIHLTRVNKYLANQSHPNHDECKVCPEKTYGYLTNKNYTRQARGSVKKINLQRGKIGRHLETFAFWIISGFADGSDLSETEEHVYETRMAKALAPDGLITSRVHRNLNRKCSDFNWVLSGWIDGPLRARRTNRDDLYRRACDMSNTIVRELNKQRIKQGRELIILAADVKKEKARKSRGLLIEEELAEIGRKTQVTYDNLDRLIERYGHRVTEYHPTKNLIRIIPRNRKKAICLYLDRLIAAAYIEPAIDKNQKTSQQKSSHIDESALQHQMGHRSR